VTGPTRRARLAIEASCVVGAALALTALLAVVGAGDEVRGDQQEINAIVEKRLDPSILPRDALYGTPVIGLYTPSFIWLEATIARWRGNDPRAALQALVWPLGVAFVLGHYLLFRYVTGSPVAAALGAASALTIRNSLGGDYWGFDGLTSAQPRTLMAAVVPPLLLLFLRWRQRAGFPAYFLGLGLLANLHPVSGFHLAQVTAAGHLWLERFQGRAVRCIMAGVLLFTLGASPLALAALGGRESVADRGALSTVRSAFAYRFPYALFPISAETLISVGVHAALLVAVVAWLAWTRQIGSDLRILLSLSAIAVLLGVAGAAIVQTLGWLIDRPYVDVLQMRATKLAYPGLTAALAVGYARLLALRSVRSIVAVTVLFGLSLVPPDSAIHASPGLRASVKRLLGMPVPAANPTPRADLDAQRHLGAWVRAATPADALFFTDRDAVRFQGKRSITGTFKDGGWMFLGGTKPFQDWYLYMREIDGCRAVQGRGCWFELGRRLGADYVVIDPGVPAATPPAGFERVWNEDAWSVWRQARNAS
jgi:hypothetical protein